jgi:putative ABC transport system ATP-binding protein
MDKTIILEGQDIKKSFKQGPLSLEILKGINFQIPEASFTVLVGPSGSGKSTLLGIIAGVDNATKGKLIFDGQDITKMSEDKLAGIRNEKIGIVFQNYNLIPTLTALENIEVPLYANNKYKSKEIRAKALNLLNLVGLEDRKNHRPGQLSGGQQQRVAIARALIGSQKLIVADEPTGNLDSKNGEKIIELLLSLQKDLKLTLVIATHDKTISDRADQIIYIRDGELSNY